MDTSGDKSGSSALSRVAKFIIVRAAILSLMISIGIFLAIIVINYGGYIDDIHRADIDESLNFISLGMRGASNEQIAQATEQFRWAMEEAYGLHKPFLLRCIRWFYQTITFDWGTTYSIGVDRFLSSKAVKVSSVVLERVPYTLLLAGSTNILLFIAGILVAVNLSKRFGSFIDRLMVAISPLSSIPNWVYGILLTVIFAGELHILPFNGMFDTFPPATKWGYIPIVLKHMVLPVSAIFLGMFFSTVYSWRTFFLIHSGEDYLELAKAKGLPAGVIERRYLLKPTLPYIITSFAMLIVTFWQGIIVLEVFFDWPGLGKLFLLSIQMKEMSVTIGIVVVFALLLGLSVFLLDIIYVLVDPRVRISSEGQTVKPFQAKSDGGHLLSPLKALQPSRIKQKIEDFLDHYLPNLLNPAYQSLPGKVSPAPGARKSPPLTSKRMGTIEFPPVRCPYLRLEITQAQALTIDSMHYRCYVHDRPERIGKSFQIEVCQTNGYRTCPRLTPATVIPSTAPKQQSQTTPARPLQKAFSSFFNSLREFTRFPAAILGVMIIVGMIIVSIYAVVTIPYPEAIARWGPESVGKYQIPKNAQPAWVNFFRKDKLPPTFLLNSADPASSDGSIIKTFQSRSSGVVEETITYTVDYPYRGFPQDVLIVFNGQYVKKPFVTLTWTTPDGRDFVLGNLSAVSSQRYLVSQDLPQKYITGQAVYKKNFFSGTGGAPVAQILFKPPGNDASSPAVNGTYTLRIDTVLFEQGSNLDAELILYGQVYGLAGTDDVRRDLMVALMWGTPIALAFGVLGAISTGVLSMLIAAVGVWFGGKLDSVIQRLTEINMILPTLPMAIMIYYLYSKSIWVILGVIIILSIFGSSIKTYRAAFLQVKELPYIEAARSYGASNWRIIRQYLIPRIIPLLIPQLVILVPSYVFFEATLAYLNVSDPFLPTWGKVVYDALTRGSFQGYYYWVLEPVVLMVITALAFAFVGFALDSILNPRLRRI